MRKERPPALGGVAVSFQPRLNWLLVCTRFEYHGADRMRNKVTSGLGRRMRVQGKRHWHGCCQTLTPVEPCQRSPGGQDGLGRARATYVRRQPEPTILHRVVREHLETFLAEARLRGGEGLPRFVERELCEFLTCGVLTPYAGSPPTTRRNASSEFCLDSIHHAADHRTLGSSLTPPAAPTMEVVMSRLSQSLLGVFGLLAVSSVASHVATAQPRHPVRRSPAQCSSVPCGGSCAICPPCTAGSICPKAPCRLGACETDASNLCQCVPVHTPAPPPTPQCSDGPCGGPCTIRPPCTPQPGTACPQFLVLGKCQADAASACHCAPVQQPTPTPTPCVDRVLCIRGYHWSPTQCQCVPDNPAPTPCIDPVLCIRGFHWSPTQCRCVPDNPTPTPCIDTVLCIRGHHWSPERCACVVDRPHSPGAPHAPHSPHHPR